jgi:desulfoferrodoxin (superoxide reductase-like protein)
MSKRKSHSTPKDIPHVESQTFAKNAKQNTVPVRVGRVPRPQNPVKGKN